MCELSYEDSSVGEQWNNSIFQVKHKEELQCIHPNLTIH